MFFKDTLLLLLALRYCITSTASLSLMVNIPFKVQKNGASFGSLYPLIRVSTKEVTI